MGQGGVGLASNVGPTNLDASEVAQKRLEAENFINRRMDDIKDRIKAQFDKGKEMILHEERVTVERAKAHAAMLEERGTVQAENACLESRTRVEQDYVQKKTVIEMAASNMSAQVSQAQLQRRMME